MNERTFNLAYLINYIEYQIYSDVDKLLRVIWYSINFLCLANNNNNNNNKNKVRVEVVIGTT